MIKGRGKPLPSFMTKSSRQLWDESLWFAVKNGASVLQIAALNSLSETEFKGIFLRSEWFTSIDEDGDVILSFIEIGVDDVKHVSVVIDHLGLIETSDRCTGRYSVFDPYEEARKGGHPDMLIWILEDSFFRQFYE